MFNLESYTATLALFPRLLGIIYLFAFGAFLFQIRGLIGKNGILPVSEYLDLLRIHYPRKRFYLAPTLFWINCSDAMLMGVASAGTFCSILLILGFIPSLFLLLAYILYLSIVEVGQDFLSFGWEVFFLEITLNAFFLSLTVIPNPMIWISINLLLFRFHFQAGVSKLISRDSSWRDLTAIAHHYQTQPLPNTTAWYVYKLPMGFQKLSTLLMFVIELIIPFGIFLTEDIRLIVFVAFVGLQLTIWFTGNFSYLNHLTVVLCTILLNNISLSYFVNAPVPQTTPFLLDVFLYLVGSALVLFQLFQQWHYFWPCRYFEGLLRWCSILHMVHRYGIFAVMTTKRYEIIVEGSRDGVIWMEYTFRYKPSEITRRPRRISPYQPRIDWQAWFLPFTNFHSSTWFQKFLVHLLKGTPEVLSLLRNNPFEGNPPKYIRATIYDYVFSTSEEKKKHGWWWRRQLIGPYSPVLSLKETSTKS